MYPEEGVRNLSETQFQYFPKRKAFLDLFSNEPQHTLLLSYVRVMQDICKKLCIVRRSIDVLVHAHWLIF